MRVFVVIFLPAFLLGFYQNCTRSQFGEEDVQSKSFFTRQGNGEGYSGKLYVLEMGNANPVGNAPVSSCEGQLSRSAIFAAHTGVFYYFSIHCQDSKVMRRVDPQEIQFEGSQLSLVFQSQRYSLIPELSALELSRISEAIQNYESHPVPGGSSTVGVVAAYEGSGYDSSPLHSFCYSKRGTVKVEVVNEQLSVLVLSSYEPVDWLIVTPSPNQIQKVILLGHYPQKVSGHVAGAEVVERTALTYRESMLPVLDTGPFVDGVKDPTGTIFHWAGESQCSDSSGAVPAGNRSALGSNSNPQSLTYEPSQDNDLVIWSLLGTSSYLFQGAYKGSEFVLR